MFTVWCAIDSVDRNEQLAGKDRHRVTDAGSEAFILAAVSKTHSPGAVHNVALVKIISWNHFLKLNLHIKIDSFIF